MEVKILDRQHYSEWDRFVDTSPQGSLYGKSWFLDTLNLDYKILSIVNNNGIIAGMVLPKNELHLYSNPLFVKYLGVFFKPYDGNPYKIESEKINICEKLIESIEGYKTFDYFFSPDFKNWLPFYHRGYRQQTYYSYIIDFENKDFQTIYSGFYKSLRNEISFAQKSELYIQHDLEFELFYDVIEKTFKRQGGSPPFKKEKIRGFVTELSKANAFKTFGAYTPDGRLTTMAGIGYDSRCAYLLFNGLKADNPARGANELLISSVIEYFMSLSGKFDFEGSMLKPIESFYRKFGGVYTPYMRIWKDSLLNSLKIRGISLYKKLKYGK